MRRMSAYILRALDGVESRCLRVTQGGSNLKLESHIPYKTQAEGPPKKCVEEKLENTMKARGYPYVKKKLAVHSGKRFDDDRIISPPPLTSCGSERLPPAFSSLARLPPAFCSLARLPPAFSSLARLPPAFSSLAAAARAACPSLDRRKLVVATGSRRK